ncbi:MULTISPECIES: tRNA (N(6)-L-threonylcarbamoyladenosine(37)-C(2))-methylthiotransferase MtaB [unclassified Treponema]|uniref:tRNA (N(6)-L-threonylcarbamoyladenosine(37)-C(2))- methylthiotransferase MtaB n=1 Tax=unclassified Treponema TaxID=2638727 RepID=UPI0020A40C38|nr:MULTISPECIES: tRNA (N(6)-L-threonylcarbamoyladenosine(37)-C(2))-methylthiotransferase MtaB [unclassified Treponema]UTC67601.1 tRNA (N(6)-L-threonylcarbamoyladenosine(37)-C(2))-methylthiotransferase MtaB [Treponema sp. OMZ 789]UTC70328.1 tRNA (N(6)-L-threonylcarbamoyladenosine(37)-C(2))-methylthiotransferase MtaB [Treponema sp. OMZ 790]UTC73043.1 tRNA (N(6)-L-threonylcarbamoyladenosine(37)-C(2))-methylthiotransferase MtaB [Treponema sp. OMZ 791]
MGNFFSVRIETLGCRLNQVESEALAFRFAECGFDVFSKETELSVLPVKLCIVNTCTVTGKAEQKARRLIRLLLKEHGEAVILVTGCYAELEADAVEKIDERVIAFSGKKKDELDGLAQFLKEICLKNKNIKDEVFNLKENLLIFRNKIYSKETKSDKPFLVKETERRKAMFKLSSPVFFFHSRASLKVQDGCNNACAYCRIRLARGLSVSLPAEEAVRRIIQIEKNGASEVVLSGVNLSQYKDKTYGGFASLLAMLLENTKQIRIRISSMYPECIDENVLKIIENARICPHFHLSVQSGSDKILKAMNRPYREADIRRAVDNLRKAKDNPFIGCDIITGFPSETEEDFLQTFKMCEELKIPGIHVFPFSARPGTTAYSMKPKVPEREAGRRASLLSALSEKNYQEYLASCSGKVFFGVMEKPQKNDNLRIVTENYLTLPLKMNKKTENYKSGEGLFVIVKDGIAYLAD